ncbi:MAG: hypothetical protein AB7N91_19880 [Candidatus Tectimicrobiota bacterium]
MEPEIPGIPYVPASGYPAVGTPQPGDPPQRSPDAPSRVTVLSPQGGEVVMVGHPVLIRWHSSCYAGLVFHQVQLSTDGGATYPRNLSPLLDGQDSHYLWSPTDDVVTPTARIRIVAINWGEATTDGPFSIVLQQPDEAGRGIPAIVGRSFAFQGVSTQNHA